MTDRAVLIGLHEFMTKELGVNELIGHLHELRRIISKIPKNQWTVADMPFNNLESLEEYLERKEKT